ncbi:MAG: alkaline phosphatase family protein [Terriglobales bacterium]
MKLPRLGTALALPAGLLIFSLLLAPMVLTLLAPCALASAYDARPKLVVVIVIDQFRGDYLERYHNLFVAGGFRVFMERGAYFTDCNYDYANTRTAPGHATLFTGSYTNGHGIVANEWWDPDKKKRVSSVEDGATKLVGIDGHGPGASPHNLLSDTLGDELKLATGGKAHVFSISLKDRAAVLPGGFSADGAYWIDPKSGLWITSSFYRAELPGWVRNFDTGHRAEKYLNLEWKDENGEVLGSTAPRNGSDGKPAGFYEVVGSTPFANQYEFDFAKELVLYEKLGTGPVTDLLTISLSANDILGHRVGPDSPEMRGMALALDRQIADFIDFLGHQVGMANVWMALSADHGVAPLPEVAKSLRLPAGRIDGKALVAQVNAVLSKKFGKQAEYVRDMDYSLAWLNEDTFTAAGVNEISAEIDAGEALKQVGFSGYFTKYRLGHGTSIPNTEMGRRYLHSYSPEGGWYVMGVPKMFEVGAKHGTDHATPFSYDTHVPLAFYGLAFQTGIYRSHAEPVDLAVTLASLLGINAPAQATGRVLTEALTTRRTSPPAAGEHASAVAGGAQ